jgi:1-deoxyxylulose-5-phosphate synthase
MIYRAFGRTGIRVAPLALGTDNFLNPTSELESAQMVSTALDAGINLFDTSNSYKNGQAERILGQTLGQLKRRQDAIIATKVHYPTGTGANDYGNSRKHILSACEDSLKRLGTDYIDLYQLHRLDDTPFEETLSALNDLVQRGWVRYIGCSTAPAWRILEGLQLSETKNWVGFSSEQPPYNLLDRRIENELIPMAQKYNLAILPWSPLAMGMLAGRYENPSADSRAVLRGGIYADRVNEKAITIGNAFVALAREHGFDPVQLAVLWVKDQASVTAPIIGPRTVEQLQNYLPVLEMNLSDELRVACDALVPAGSAVANFLNSSGWSKQRLAW